MNESQSPSNKKPNLYRRRLIIGFFGIFSVVYLVGSFMFIRHLTTGEPISKLTTHDVKHSVAVASAAVAENDEIVRKALAHEAQLRIDWEHRRRSVPEGIRHRSDIKHHAYIKQLKENLSEFEEIPEGSVAWIAKQKLDE